MSSEKLILKISLTRDEVDKLILGLSMAAAQEEAILEQSVEGNRNLGVWYSIIEAINKEYDEIKYG